MTLNVVVTETGPLFTLDEARAHLRVDSGEEDALIGAYSDAAVAHVLQYCNIATVPDGPVPEAAFKVAALITLTAFFERRPLNADEARSVRDLIDFYRWLRV